MATTIVQAELPPSAPSINRMSWVPATAVNVPLQLLTGAGADPPAISRPAGSESLNSMPDNGTFPVFWIVIVSRENEPGAIGFGEKYLLMLAPGRLVSEAEAGSGLVAPFAVLT